MAKSAAIPLALGGAASILIISGIQGESLGEVLKGEFGKGTKHPPANPAFGKPKEPGYEGENPEQEIASVSGSIAAPSITPGGSTIVQNATSQLGVKYVWGGESEKNGFDCSGLTQWVYAKSGIHIPRTAQEQYNYMRKTTNPKPGDLVFFGSSKQDVSHVGIVAMNGLMIDAPHTGAVVRFEHFNPAIGSSYGSDKLIGYGQA